jgi:hypothetical protein
MQKLQAKQEACYNYLSAMTENWQLYKAVQRGNALYGIKSDNLVEQFFSCILEQRFYSPYYLIEAVLEKEFAKLQERRDRAAKVSSWLTPFAARQYSLIMSEMTSQNC